MDAAWLFVLHASAFLGIGLFAGFWAVKRSYIPRQFVLMSAFGVVAILYYLIFFLFLINPTLGRWGSYLILVVGWLLAVYGLAKFKKWRSDKTVLIAVLLPLSMMVLLTGYYSAVLVSCRIPVPGSQKDDNSTYCHIHALPGDNALPYQYADNLTQGKPEALISDWKLVDRPPIQVGAALSILSLSSQPTKTQPAYQIVATFLQLTWVAALLGILISFGLKFKHVLLAVGVMSLSGFVFINSVFVWPKFFAGSFVAVASVLLLTASNKSYRRSLIAAFIGMALGLLIHDGVSFTIIGVGAVFAALLIKNTAVKNDLGLQKLVRPLLIGSAIALLLLAPWFAYKSVHTASDRLIKWHFAGVVEPDNRTTAQTIVDAYKQTPLPVWLEGRKANVEMLYEPVETKEFSQGVESFGSSKTSLRQSLGHFAAWVEANDFFIVFLALGLLNLGWLVVLLKSQRKQVSKDEKRLLWAILISAVFWIVVMFLPRSTVLHQGSYATMIIIYGLLTAWLGRINWLLPLLVCQFVIFNTFWVIGGFLRYETNLHRAVLPVLIGLLLYVGLIVLAKKWRLLDKNLAALK